MMGNEKVWQSMCNSVPFITIKWHLNHLVKADI